MARASEPRKQALKVFRAPMGFYDVYVAAPSQKAALAAWGSEHDLSARGIAEKVDDPALAADPLRQPGVIVRRLRGTTAEQMAALPEAKPVKRRGAAASELGERRLHRLTKKREKKRKGTRPNRSSLTAAEQALANMEAKHAIERKDMEARIARLRQEQERLKIRQTAEMAKLTGVVDRTREKYEHDFQAWQEEQS